MELALDNDDVLTEIFLRLPAKSLTRFKSVCKKWLSLISSDHFCHLHTLRRPKPQPSLIIAQTYSRELFYLNPTTNGEKKMIPYSLSVPVPDCKIAHACNGLMLLKFRQHDMPLKKGYYIYNPTTKRSRMIILTHNDEYPHVAWVKLAFDPSHSPYYKIVCIKSSEDPYSPSECTYQIEVYDSESQTWKLGLQFTDLEPCPPFHGTHWNNAIYWRNYEEDDDCCYSYFNIDKNEMKTLSSPQPLYPISLALLRETHLQELNGRLYHFDVYLRLDGAGEIESRSVAVQELARDDDHHSQWLLKHHDPFTSTAWRSRTIRFLGLIRGSVADGDGDGTFSLLTYDAGKIRAYSLLDKSYEELVDFTSQPLYRPDLNEMFKFRCFQFGETLALV